MISRVAAPINRLKPAPRFVVETGDNVVSRGKEEFAAHKAFTAALEIPYYNMPGNHDTYNDTMPWRNYEEVHGQPYYAWQYGGVHFVVFVRETSYLSPAAAKRARGVKKRKPKAKAKRSRRAK